MVDVSRSGDHLHASTARMRSRSASRGTQRRSSRQRPCSTRPTTAGSPSRNGSAYDSGRLIAHPGSSTPGPLPPPTVPTAGINSAGSPRSATTASVRARSSSGSACSARAVGVGGPLERGLERRKRELVDADRARQRMTSEPGDEVDLARDDPRLRTTEELVAARSHDIGSGLECAGDVRLVGKHTVGGQQPRAHVDDERRSERRRARRYRPSR